MIKSCKFTIEITIKPWARFLVSAFVFIGMYPPEWLFSVKTVDVKGQS